jgi:hypothetical protein
MPPTPRVASRHRTGVAAILLILTALGAIALPSQPAAADRITANGWTTSGRTDRVELAPGTSVTITVDVTASTSRRALVDVEVYDAQGRRVLQRFWDGQSFAAGQRVRYRPVWSSPAGVAGGTYTVKVGVFGEGWSGLLHWNDRAATFSVTGTAPPPTTAPPTTAPPTTAPPTTAPATTAPPTTAPPTTAPPSGRFVTLPVGAVLPGDAECAARVRDAAEIRPANASYNQTTGGRHPDATGLYTRVSGNFTGTTDEIIQWASCKWGFDEDVIRAQTAKESWWFQRNGGDFTTDPTRCAPGHGFGVDGRPGECAESVGVQQVRYPYHQWAFPWATYSTAQNLDYALAVRRACFEGYETWFNHVERGRDYVAGDLWGCIGAWFSGRWYTPASVTYIADVQNYLNQRIWTRPEFINFTG